VTGESLNYFVNGSIINVWWVIPVIIVYWPAGKCGKTKIDKERRLSRSNSNASGTGGMEGILNEEEDVFTTDSDEVKSDFDEWAGGNKNKSGDFMAYSGINTSVAGSSENGS
jgi:hypothetical protein